MLTVYTQPGCPPCDMVKKFLTMKNIEYVEKDRAGNENEMIAAAGVISTPVIVSDKGVAIGPNIPRILEIA